MRFRSLAYFLVFLLAACGGLLLPDPGSEDPEIEDSGKRDSSWMRDGALHDTPSSDANSGPDSDIQCHTTVDWYGECRLLTTRCNDRAAIKIEVHCYPGSPEGPPGNPDPGPR